MYLEREVSDTLELELWMVISYLVGPGNGIQATNSKCSLTNPSVVVIICNFKKLLFHLYETLHVFISVCHVCVWCSQKIEEGIESSGTGAMDHCDCHVDTWN